MSKLTAVPNALASGEPLPPKRRDHPLTGSLRDFRECPIEPDRLLVYQIHDDVPVLTATGTETRAGLFGKKQRRVAAPPEMTVFKPWCRPR